MKKYVDLNTYVSHVLSQQAFRWLKRKQSPKICKIWQTAKFNLHRKNVKYTYVRYGGFGVDSDANGMTGCLRARPVGTLYA